MTTTRSVIARSPPQYFGGRRGKLICKTILVLLGIMLVSGAAYAIDNSDCLICHSDKTLKKAMPGGREQSLFIDEKEYSSSIHGKNLCASCHDDIAEVPHQENLKPVLCSKCHRIETEVYNQSDHGKAVAKDIKEAASCKDCHGEHHIILNSRDPESPVNRRNIPATCGKCHADDKLMEKYRLSEAHPYKSYIATVHGKALSEKGEFYAAECTDCHGSHDLHSSANPNSKINRKNVGSTCGKCHENVYKTFQMSVHGKAIKAGIKDAPACTDCHGEHTIESHEEPTSSVYPTNISRTTCPRCHAAERIITKYGLPSKRLETYMASYHGLASQMNVTIVANCASCHGVHDILPSSDPDSSINKKNLHKTCGKCHPGVTQANLMQGNIHTAGRREENRIVYYVTVFYIVLILVVIGGMFMHNLLDYRRKVLESFKKAASKRGEERWNLNERIQHIILLVTFAVLAYTGFAIKFPQSWIGYPFGFEGGAVLRGLIHRIAAGFFCLLCLYHVWYLLCTTRGRFFLSELMPVRKDFEDVLQMLRFYLGLAQTRPGFARFNYVEKSEYWALIWGSAIMVVTGLLLTFENFSMAHFPIWVLDLATVIHFFEAVLATLAIVIWHFYFTVFDPRTYPMDFSWLTGRKTEEEKNHR